MTRQGLFGVLLSCILQVDFSPPSCRRSHHFMVITDTEFLLVNPDKTRLGWGVVHFIAFLQVDRVGGREEGEGGGKERGEGRRRGQSLWAGVG